MDVKDQKIRELENQVKDLTMRLSAIKVITTKIEPICSQRLQELLEACEGCKGDGNTADN